MAALCSSEQELSEKQFTKILRELKSLPLSVWSDSSRHLSKCQQLRLLHYFNGTDANCFSLTALLDLIRARCFGEVSKELFEVCLRHSEDDAIVNAAIDSLSDSSEATLVDLLQLCCAEANKDLISRIIRCNFTPQLLEIQLKRLTGQELVCILENIISHVQSCINEVATDNRSYAKWLTWLGILLNTHLATVLSTDNLLAKLAATNEQFNLMITEAAVVKEWKILLRNLTSKSEAPSGKQMHTIYDYQIQTIIL